MPDVTEASAEVGPMTLPPRPSTLRSGPSRGKALLRIGVPLAVAAAVSAGCSSSPSSGSSTPHSTAATSPSQAASQAPTEASAPSASLTGQDDVNDDGQADRVCGTQNFGAGLVMRIPCDVSTAHEPESGTVLVKKSLYRLPTPDDIDLSGISGELIGGRDPQGGKVEILIFNSDALFATGGSTIGSADTLKATVRLVNAQWPGTTLQVRGHTDSSGSAAANQALSQRRARTVRSYLISHGIKAASLTAVGLGSKHPLVRNDSAAGRSFNRRVELVIRVPNA